MADEDAAKTIRELLLAIEIADHLHTFMPREQAASMMHGAAELLLHIVASGGKGYGLTSLTEAFGLLSLIGTSALRQRAGGRKLTNQAKRNRLAADVSMLRDAADRLEAVLLAEGKEKHRAD